MDRTVRPRPRAARVLVIALSFLPAAAAGPPLAHAAAGGKASGGAFEVEWFLLEGGGGALAGLAFQGVGSIGATAAAAAMAGGTFELTGGYLPPGSATPAGSQVFASGFEGGAD
jgi:hypothetical protein